MTGRAYKISTVNLGLRWKGKKKKKNMGGLVQQEINCKACISCNHEKKQIWYKHVLEVCTLKAISDIEHGWPKLYTVFQLKLKPVAIQKRYIKMGTNAEKGH